MVSLKYMKWIFGDESWKYVTYCVTLARTLVLHLQLNVAYLSIRETLGEPTFSMVLACYAGNPGVSASLLNSSRLAIGDFFDFHHTVNHGLTIRRRSLQ
jgi:hypothetical protein